MPVERIFAIYQAIQRGRFPNCSQLAAELEVTPKTVQRDISFMQRHLGLPIAYDSRRHGYFYERPVADFPLLKISVEDLVALFLARKAIEPLQGSPLEGVLRSSFQRLSQSLQGTVSFRWTEIDEIFSVKDSGVVPGDVRHFEKVSRAVLECRELRFEYRKIDSDSWELRGLQPYHLAEVDGGWYLIGYDADRRGRRTFAMQRMRSLRVLKSRFLRPADFSLAEHLGESFGVWRRDGERGTNARIRLRFDGWAARLVSERRWHPSQEIRWLGKREESLEMSLELSGFEEISRWILSWGSQVEVLDPPELRELVRESLLKASDRYR